MKIVCAHCHASVDKPDKEIQRQLRNGAKRFFCSRSCAAVAGNLPRQSPSVIRYCLYCHKEIRCRATKKSPIFCSRSCASAGSVTDYRRERARQNEGVTLTHDIATIAASLRSREAWKYADLESHLCATEITHEFESPIGNYIFDLRIDKSKTLVEFDGDDHRYSRTMEEDAKKDACAQSLGWRVHRVTVTPGEVIPVSALSGIL